jgi:hypothetical protein
MHRLPKDTTILRSLSRGMPDRDNRNTDPELVNPERAAWLRVFTEM